MRDPAWPSPKTICPECGQRDSRVLQTRPSATHPGGIWRRRVCVCGVRFSTIELTHVSRRRERVYVPFLPSLV